jgi:hypothetical protein
MVGTNDSLYIISQTPNNQGIFFRIDENGAGYEVIWEFDNVNWEPFSLLANDTIIYGTTRFSSNGGGTIFQYSLTDYSFQFIRDFESNEVQDAQIKYITDSALWLSSQQSHVDNGSIFTINKDGSGLTKIYNDTNFEKGQNPVDFVFYENKIYIACYNGGGIPYEDGFGGMVASGSFIRINADGTGYEKIIAGGNAVGTQPQSIIIRENQLFGLFAYSGGNYSLGGQFFRSNLDGSNYDSLGALNNRALTKMLSTDSLIYGISSHNVFGINPFTAEIRIFDDLHSNPDFGSDVVANPAFLNGKVFIAAQQGGPDSGGTILKWLNEKPDVDETAIKITNGRLLSEVTVNLNELFSDPEGDSLSFSIEYDQESVSIFESNGALTITPLKFGEHPVIITTTDGWAGYKSVTITVNQENVTSVSEQELQLLLYPNPTQSILRFSESRVESIEIMGLDGKVYATFSQPENEIDISSLQNGIYIANIRVDGISYSQKIVKY